MILFLYFNVFQYLECEVGYIGPRCQTPCPSLSYGPNCRFLCNCYQSECDNIKGCVTGKILVFLTLFLVCIRMLCVACFFLPFDLSLYLNIKTQKNNRCISITALCIFTFNYFKDTCILVCYLYG